MVYRNPLVAQEKVRRLVRHRRRVRRAKVASLAVLTVVLVGAAAFGIDRGVVFAHHLWAEHHRPVTAPSASTTTTTTTVPGPPRCAPTQLNAYLYDWRITAGTLFEVVALANTSASPCTLAGYVGLSVTAPGGATLPGPVHDDPALGGAAGTSTVPVPVMSGQRAWFELTYPVACASVLAQGQQPSGAPGQCYEGGSLGVLVPQATAALEVTQPLRFTYGTAGFAVGPFGSGTPPSSPPVG
jgi:hypothetical protein